MKFFRRGISEIVFAPAVADPTAPTRTEMTAGEVLTPEVAAIAGFQLSNAPIPVPNLRTRFTPTITGEDTVADSTITFNDDDVSETIRTALAKDTTGFLIMLPYGDIAAKRCEVWAVTVTGFNDEWSLDNTSAKAVAGFAVNEVPEQEGVVPALV